MRIDAHQHYWKPERGDYGWLKPSMTALYRDYLPEHLQPHLTAHAIDRTVLVQAAPTAEETEYMLSLCRHDSSIAGVVGWIDMESDRFREDFLRLRENKHFVGIRPMLHDLEDERWILRPNVLASLQVLIDHHFPIDFLVFPQHLPVLLELMKRLPNLRGVIDHIGKPHIRSGAMEPWKQQMSELAQYPNLYCKLSGMVTEADHERWKAEDFEPYIQHVLAVFGAERVMFGSDWPVCLLAASYDQVIQVLEACLPEHLGPEARQAVYGGNAMRFYRLPAKKM